MARIVIIGGGVAGLAAGIRARLRGHEAVILERHRVPGGNLTGWERDGYHIDNCIHWLTGTNPVTDQYRIWEELGVLGDVPLRRTETLYTYAEGDKRLSLSRDIEQLERDMRAYSEGDGYEIERFIRAVKAAQTVMGISAEQNDRRPALSELVRRSPALLPYLNITTGQLAERFYSPMLRGFLESLLTGCFGALALLIVFATFCSGNGDIPVGGSVEAAGRMAQRFTSLGGVLLCGTPAASIELGHGWAQFVRTADGRRIAADYVVLACDPACAFGSLLDSAYLPQRLRRRYEDARLRLFSSFHAAFGCATDVLPWRGDLILDAPALLRERCGTRRLILREFSHEPSFAPAGHSLVQAMCFCTMEKSRAFISLREDRGAYRALKEQLCACIAGAVSAQFPLLGGRLRLLDSWTPATYRRYTGAPSGSYIGFTLPAGRIPTMIPPRVKGITNLYLATQWQQLPGGLPTAAGAGLAATDAILRADRRSPAALLRHRGAAVTAVPFVQERSPRPLS